MVWTLEPQGQVREPPESAADVHGAGSCTARRPTQIPLQSHDA